MQENIEKGISIVFVNTYGIKWEGIRNKEILSEKIVIRSRRPINFMHTFVTLTHFRIENHYLADEEIHSAVDFNLNESVVERVDAHTWHAFAKVHIADSGGPQAVVTGGKMLVLGFG